jgi:hypothetical protein
MNRQGRNAGRVDGAGNDEQWHGDVSGGQPQRNNQPERSASHQP